MNIVATLKHIASKSSNYGRPLEYLMFEHDTNGKPIRDEEGEPPDAEMLHHKRDQLYAVFF